ncbi:MAG: radical SAM family heme chaperone HemW [Verrucomicrobiota bacterium]
MRSKENVQRSTSNVQRSTSGGAIKHLYVHIPFCARICPYCAFYKERADPSQTQRFCEALLLEVDQHREKLAIQPETIFFGGGTPTTLSIAQLELILRGFRDQLDLRNVIEWTVEANPGSVSARKAATLHRGGINRISLGVQSWDDQLLQKLGREHNAAQAETSFQIFREAGFANISIDLMFGIPGQTIEHWKASLEKTISLQPQHVSCYCLTYEEDTEFFRRESRGELRADPEADAEFFTTAFETLEAVGYFQYEISNYAQPGYASAHNQSYWVGDNYLGIGPSAFSTVESQRWQNVCDYRAYTDALFAGTSIVGSTEALTPEMKRGEMIALSLRTRGGVSASLLEGKNEEVQEFAKLGLMHECEGNLLLTPAGKLLADSVAEAFI